MTKRQRQAIAFAEAQVPLNFNKIEKAEAKFKEGDVLLTTDHDRVIVKEVYPDDDLSVIFPDELIDADKLYTLSPKDIVSFCKKRKKYEVSKFQVGDILTTTTDDRVCVKKVYYNNELAVCFPDEKVGSKKIYTILPSEICSAKKDRQYNKDEQETLSKTAQNDSFVERLQLLGKDMKEIRVLVLDTKYLRTTQKLLAAGLLPSRIFIPQPDVEEAECMLAKYPTLKVFGGKKAGDLIFQLADKKLKFDGLMLDYCGCSGMVGQKNKPADDIFNLFHYDMINAHSVLTFTVCARSVFAVTKKFESYYGLVKVVQKFAKKAGFKKIYKAKNDHYTDYGCQTMSHHRCMLMK